MRKLLIILLLISCHKEKIHSGTVTFYQSDYMQRSQYLWIDGKVIDVLNSTYYIDSNGYTPDCKQNLFPYIRSVDLTLGVHKYWLRYNFKNSDTFTIDVKYPCQLLKVGP